MRAKPSLLFAVNLEIFMAVRTVVERPTSEYIRQTWKETVPLLPNKLFLGNTPLRKQQVLKEAHLHYVEKVLTLFPGQPL